MITIDTRAPAYVDLAEGFDRVPAEAEQQPGASLGPPPSPPVSAPPRPWLQAFLAKIAGLFRDNPESVPAAPIAPRRPRLPPSQTWWQRIKVDNQAAAAGLANRTVGSIGERLLLDVLSQRLGDDYIAVCNILLLRNLDSDLIVIGPSGLWVLESKYWSGRVTLQKGHWTHTSASAAAAHRPEPPSDPDGQWTREKAAVFKSLGGANLIIANRGWPLEAIKGGLAFTHPAAHLDIDDSCQAPWGTPQTWADRIHTAPAEPCFSTRLQLKSVDALLASSLRLQPSTTKPKSAVDLAATL